MRELLLARVFAYVAMSAGAVQMALKTRKFGAAMSRFLDAFQTAIIKDS
jgi:hypothetical protein